MGAALLSGRVVAVIVVRGTAPWFYISLYDEQYCLPSRPARTFDALVGEPSARSRIPVLMNVCRLL
jgi:hypothetical protein